MEIPIYQIDAFTQTLFRGNPAAVCPLPAWLDDTRLQAIATENNLSETAFFVPRDGHYHLRWFTPTQEVPLCGHATLAAAFVIFCHLSPADRQVTFETQSGTLQVSRANDGGADDGGADDGGADDGGADDGGADDGGADDGGPTGGRTGDRQCGCLTLDLPRARPARCDPPLGLLAGLGQPPVEVLATRGDPNYYAVYEQEEDIWALAPALSLLADLHPYGVAVTAPGRSVDFVSRYFAPSYGIPEDPVTGSIHCALAPYWAKRLDKRSLTARQISKRQGDLYCEVKHHRVWISGYAVEYLAGRIVV